MLFLGMLRLHLTTYDRRLRILDANMYAQFNLIRRSLNHLRCADIAGDRICLFG